uniref:Uncharacterized protein n=1 Tax=Entomoneis paludosa TaxID=265537 RepID=A0A7S2VCE6_9STRA|mmetsp:Transcript_16156/g.33426  ORF Transcript_16156/g.33426 Transcript_16156/m.33426 type:complete len:179 (+) Transcript_16156:41-577(+)
MSSSSAIPLPTWSIVTSFLSHDEATKLVDSIPALKSSTTTLFDRKHWRGESATGDHPRCTDIIPTENENGVVHSVSIDFRWCDQGWGNKKGRLSIVAHNHVIDQRDDDSRRGHNNFQDGRIVCQTGIAPQIVEKEQLQFYPQPNEHYSLWYQVGGGGGHELTVENVQICTVYFDNEFV